MLDVSCFPIECDGVGGLECEYVNEVAEFRGKESEEDESIVSYMNVYLYSPIAEVLLLSCLYEASVCYRLSTDSTGLRKAAPRSEVAEARHPSRVLEDHFSHSFRVCLI